MGRPGNGTEYAFGEFSYDSAAGVLRRGEEEFRLPPKALDVLDFLIQSSGAAVSKDELLEAAWNGVSVSDQSLVQAVSVLRHALGDDARNPRYIQTLPRGGYRFVATVKSYAAPSTGLVHDVTPGQSAPPGALDDDSEDLGHDLDVPRWSPVLTWGGAGFAAATFLVALAFAAGVLGIPGEAATPRTPLRFRIHALPGISAPAALGRLLAVSPDGLHVIYVGQDGQGQRHLFDHRIDRLETRQLPGTAGARHPFFSPDGRWVGFVAEAKLRKVSLANGTVIDVCDATNLTEGTWGVDGMIVFGKGDQGLWRVPDVGGEPELLTGLNRERGEILYRRPEFLPSGDAVLFEARGQRTSDVMHLQLASGEVTLVQEDGAFPVYSRTGHIVFARGLSLYALPFDPASGRPTGAATQVFQGVSVASGMTGGAAQFALAQSGTLVYYPAQPLADRSLVWVDRRGVETSVTGDHFVYRHPSLSPDGTQMAVSIEDARDPSRQDVWLLEFAPPTFRRLTFDGENFYPSWSPDGSRVVFTARREGLASIYEIAAGAGTNQAVALLRGDNETFNGIVSPDGKWLVYREIRPTTSRDIMMQSTAAEEPPRPLVAGPYEEHSHSLSPDGRWLAYVSNESRRDEVNVTTFPHSGYRWQVSTDGGSEPVWSPRGDELFYREGRRMVAVKLRTDPDFRVLERNVLFSGDYFAYQYHPQYDVDARAEHFLMIKTRGESSEVDIHVVVEWFQELTAELGLNGP